MPTTITAQNGKTFKQNTVMKIPNCAVRSSRHRVIGNTAYLTVKTFTAGRVSGSGPGLSKTYRRLGAAPQRAQPEGAAVERRQGQGPPVQRSPAGRLCPVQRGIPNSVAYQTVTFG